MSDVPVVGAVVEAPPVEEVSVEAPTGELVPEMLVVDLVVEPVEEVVLGPTPDQPVDNTNTMLGDEPGKGPGKTPFAY